METKNKKNLTVAAAMTACLAVAGIGAYFTSTDSATNKFTVGNVKIALEEPGWVEANGANITPNKTVTKDPQVKNTGTNDAYVFLEVTVPKASVITADATGEKEAVASVKELFTMNGLNTTDWSKIDTATKSTADSVTYVYAYAKDGACTALAKEATTAKLFNSVTFVNAIEGQGLESATKNIAVKAYGIQTNDLNGGKTAPADVWAVVSNQTK